MRSRHVAVLADAAPPVAPGISHGAVADHARFKSTSLPKAWRPGVRPAPNEWSWHVPFRSAATPGPKRCGISVDPLADESSTVISPAVDDREPSIGSSHARCPCEERLLDRRPRRTRKDEYLVRHRAGAMRLLRRRQLPSGGRALRLHQVDAVGRRQRDDDRRGGVRRRSQRGQRRLRLAAPSWKSLIGEAFDGRTSSLVEEARVAGAPSRGRHPYGSCRLDRRELRTCYGPTSGSSRAARGKNAAEEHRASNSVHATSGYGASARSRSAWARARRGAAR